MLVCASYEELVAEKQAQEEADALMAAEADDDSDDEEKPTYNPLNLPLGWDGKPIPFWLYKLHGLGVEYKCEICGNESYWGESQWIHPLLLQIGSWKLLSRACHLWN